VLFDFLDGFQSLWNVLIVDENRVMQLILNEVVQKLFPEARVTFDTCIENAIERFVRRENFDLAIINTDLAALPSIMSIAQFKAVAPNIPLMVFSIPAEQDLSAQSSRTGLSEEPSPGFVRSLRVHAAKVALPQKRSQAEHPSTRAGNIEDDSLSHRPPKLTKRQIEILSLINQGMFARKISVRLGISEGTVKQHMHTIYTVLGARSRRDALAAANRVGIELTPLVRGASPSAGMPPEFEIAYPIRKVG